MKRSEAYIQRLSEKYHISPATAKAIYDAVHTFNTAARSSDYEAAAKKLNSFKSCYSPYFQKEVIDKIEAFMQKDPNYCFKNMNEEMEDKQYV